MSMIRAVRTAATEVTAAIRRSRQDGRPNGVPPLDARVGHQLEEQHEDDDGKHHGREMQEEGHRPRGVEAGSRS